MVGTIMKKIRKYQQRKRKLQEGKLPKIPQNVTLHTPAPAQQPYLHTPCTEPESSASMRARTYRPRSPLARGGAAAGPGPAGQLAGPAGQRAVPMFSNRRPYTLSDNPYAGEERDDEYEYASKRYSMNRPTMRDESVDRYRQRTRDARGRFQRVDNVRSEDEEDY